MRRLEHELLRIEHPRWTIHRVARDGTISDSPVGLDDLTTEEQRLN